MYTKWKSQKKQKELTTCIAAFRNFSTSLYNVSNRMFSLFLMWENQKKSTFWKLFNYCVLLYQKIVHIHLKQLIVELNQMKFDIHGQYWCVKYRGLRILQETGGSRYLFWFWTELNQAPNRELRTKPEKWCEAPRIDGKAWSKDRVRVSLNYQSQVTMNNSYNQVISYRQVITHAEPWSSVPWVCSVYPGLALNRKHLVSDFEG